MTCRQCRLETENTNLSVRMDVGGARHYKRLANPTRRGMYDTTRKVEPRLPGFDDKDLTG
jgi:hypothetical protein